MVKITDTILRDAHQSLAATRMRTEDMLPIIEKLDAVGFFSLEAWGGATFDSCIRFLNEDPWERLRMIKKAAKNTPIQMLLRGQNLVGYRHYSDDVVEKFVTLAAKNGVDIFRIFDAVNDVRNMEASIRAAKKCGSHVQGTICYTISPVHSNEAFVEMAKRLAELECDSICVKDMAGLILPAPAYDLVSRLKKEVGLPVDLHCHCTNGIAPMSYYAAAQAGVDILDTAMSPFSFGTSQPATESVVGALQGTPYDTGLDLKLLAEIAEYFLKVREKYEGIIDPIAERIDVNVLVYQIPGGMLSNLVSQLKQQNKLDMYDAVLKEVPVVRRELGYPPLVTPTSQIVGTQAVLNVVMGERYKVVPKEVKDYVKGFYGRTPAPVDPEIQKKVIGDEQPIACRPADLLKPEMPEVVAKVNALGLKEVKEEDYVTYALYPQVAEKFLKGEIKPEPLTPRASGQKSKLGPNARRFLIEMDGVVKEIRIEALDAPLPTVALAPAPGPVQEAAPVEEGTVNGAVTSPMQGTILKVNVKVGDSVKKGDVIAVLEAMKMENDIVAHSSGVVKAVYAQKGKNVEANAVLAIIE
ncbi:pyruvate carboxylase subunit B [Methanocella conradii HZ254]|uniref:Pyruvate carboxylase subunit B n=1 Tax=Methanocella conradii (strain DSM 24694 / JCM 17849 / CGMCC 1.5162 / HZ254) TaxID=1041930 RepID=H8I9A3_METCZ|nr:sodium-extruding oxaloacetate decarboxylase subunit alpha [Methanocella conradii]AFC99521.1 pyruvate carboxylase subunit B [Methanocella conradii HZ254]MDI6898030.1 sodium-extruding oxaloacetate decarboxylase subunit alpha [Methanocella conradii]